MSNNRYYFYGKFEENHQMLVTNQSDAKQQGYPKQEVEQAYDGTFWEVGYAPKKPLAVAREDKVAELSSKFEEASLAAHCMSSIGFEIDANPTSNRDLEGILLVLAPGEKTSFCDYHNTFHTVTREDIEVARREIVLNGQYLYAQKWSYRDAINAAQTVAEVVAIVIEFHNRNFLSEA